jgi:glycosyltransferase involved in cell wall biosynthesis
LPKTENRKQKTVLFAMKFRNVCFFLPSGYRDGAELSALECLEALRALGLQCRVILPQRGALLGDLQARGIPYHIIPYKVWIGPPAPVIIRFLFSLWNLIVTYFAVFLVGRRRCDLIITNTINLGVGALTAKLLGLPHLWYIREFGPEDHGWRFHLGENISLWVMNRCSSAAIAVSRAVSRKYQAALPGVPVHAVYQPIMVDDSLFKDAPKIAASQAPRFTCIVVGRLQEGKRQEDAVRAVAGLRDHGVRVRLWLVGGGERRYGAFLEQLVRENNLTAQVTFFGQVDNALPYIHQADVLLLCSRCEAFARVVVEALKLGKPVVGAGSGGTVEQIEDGVNGFLYPPGDHRELAAKIKYLHDHPKIAQTMGRQGKKWALKTFTPERYQRELRGILDRIP